MGSSKIVLAALVVFLSAFATATEEVESQFRRPPLPRPPPCNADRCTAQCQSRGCQVGVCQTLTTLPVPLPQVCQCQQCQQPADGNVPLDDAVVEDGPKPTSFQPCDASQCHSQCQTRGCTTGVCRMLSLRPNIRPNLLCKCQQCIEPRPANEEEVVPPLVEGQPVPIGGCNAEGCTSSCRSRGCEIGVCRMLSLRPDVRPNLLCKCQQCIEPRPANEQEVVPPLVGGEPVPIGACNPEGCTSSCRSRGCEIGVCQRISLRPVNPSQLCRCQQCPSPRSADVGDAAFVRPHFCRDEICAKTCKTEKGCVNGYCKLLGVGPHRMCECEGCDL